MQRYIRFGDKSHLGRTRLLTYYLQRIITSRRVRRLGDLIIRNALTRARLASPATQKNTTTVDAFRERGILELGRVLSHEQCHEIHDYLDKKTFATRQHPDERFSTHSRPKDIKLGDYDLETVVHCPYIMELANSPEFLMFATEYLGITPTITNVAVRWSFPAEAPASEVQFFHRDAEVGSTIKMLIYLTDVDKDSGPHVYVLKTHHDRVPLRLRLYTEDEISSMCREEVIVTGPAGIGFAIDTKGIHKGQPPTMRSRLLLTIQYALLPCLLYDYRPITRNDCNFDSYVNRLILKKNFDPSVPIS
jgi:hypothetical protein